MKESEFGDIFLKPLYKEKIELTKVNQNIYEEIINLSDWYCMSEKILNNLIYDNNKENFLIGELKKQFYLSNLKNMIHKKELAKISQLFNENEVEHVFLKGSAINIYCDDYIRYSRDIDILVNKASISKVYELLKGVGYRYHNRLVADKAKYINFGHQLPILSNGDGVYLEIHHRITEKSIFDKCPITESMLSHQNKVFKDNISFRVSSIDHLIAHLVYHAALHHNFKIGPIFLYDIKRLNDRLKNEQSLKNLLENLGVLEIYKEIIEYMENKTLTDDFSIYKTSLMEIQERKNPKKLGFLLFNKKGRKEFLKIIYKKFTKNEDAYQTSRFNPKFYLILIIEFKKYCLKLLKV